jgi:DNA-binding transcriptional LysR family regulator
MLVAAEKRSFRQAAMELGVWESTISRGIRDLEDEIGVALFNRHPGGVTLTHAGSKFLSHARAAVGRIEYALKDAGAAGRGEVGMVRIGIFSSLASGFLADLLNAYQAQNPFVHLDFAEGGPAEHVASIQHLGIDVAFLTGEPAAYGCEAARLGRKGSLWSFPTIMGWPIATKLAGMISATSISLSAKSILARKSTTTS